MKQLNLLSFRRGRLLATFLFSLFFSSHLYADQGYAVFDSTTGTLTFKYGTPTGKLNRDYYNTDATGTFYPGWNSVMSKITNVVFESSFSLARPTSCNHWFYDGSNIVTISGIENLNTSNVTDMNGMFYNCSKLSTLDVSHFNTESVTDMRDMFSGCRCTILDVSNFNTSNVTNMRSMFATCYYLSTLDVSHFNTANVTDMYGMFAYCGSLSSLDVSNFITSNVTRMDWMFVNCYGLRTLDLSNFNTANVTDMTSMFSGCHNLRSLDLSSDFNTANVIDMTSMFNECHNLRSLDVSSFNTANVTSISSLFSECRNLTGLTFGKGFAMDNCTNITNVFNGCSKLRYLDFYESDDVDAITQIERASSNSMFYNVPRTAVIYLPHGCSSITTAENVVYSYNGDETDLRCPNYYSADKKDIEFPRDFRTNKAEYSRTMSTSYGSVVLPYAFKTNADIQAYTLDEEHTETMYFVDAEEIPAHTPFAFKKLGSAQFINEDATGNFGIDVEATHTTSKAEGGAPYTNNENLSGWTTKGYYVNETVNDYAGAFYIAGDKFYKADGALTMYPHRVTFHGAWNTEPSSDSPAKFFEIATVSKSTEEQPEDVTPETDDHGLADAIKAAELRRDMREATAIYDAQGRKQNELKRGLNIFREQDGRMKKVIIR